MNVGHLAMHISHENPSCRQRQRRSQKVCSGNWSTEDAGWFVVERPALPVKRGIADPNAPTTAHFLLNGLNDATLGPQTRQPDNQRPGQAQEL
ncbi:MAG: hypothetical protein KIT82_21740 [Bradyrhizobium sp.]|nr:hypothetical protein [Bradyrhizobium sp.]